MIETFWDLWCGSILFELFELFRIDNLLCDGLYNLLSIIIIDCLLNFDALFVNLIYQIINKKNPFILHDIYIKFQFLNLNLFFLFLLFIQLLLFQSILAFKGDFVQFLIVWIVVRCCYSQNYGFQKFEAIVAKSRPVF